jgi:ElaB/YqjD/DUF883 family membrane-anchored ribosome-binding protein
MSDTPSPDAPFSINPASHDPFQAAKASAMKAAEELRYAAAAKAQELRHSAETRAQDIKAAAGQKADEFREKADEVRQYADKTLTDAKAKYADLRVEAENFAREKPLQALATAFGVGLLVGIILRR